MMKKTTVLLVAAALAGGAALAPRAQACGGFFCSNVRIDQSGEYILFSVEPNNVRAYIQIQYQGKADDFAWVVPVSDAPKKISVGVQQVFTNLMNATAPRFNIQWKDLQCTNFRGGPAFNLAPGAPMASGAAADKGVMVLDQGEVGPYQFEVLSSNDAGALKAYLDKNGFAQPASAVEPIKHYIDIHFVFVAIKLKRGAETGDIQPLVVDLPTSETCVPLVLTRIAALSDMPVYALILADHRAVPKNWFQVEINPRKINWFAQGQNYRQVVTAAIDEAAGRAFVTEYAGETSSLQYQKLWAPGQYDLSKLNGITDPARFVQVMLQIGLPRDPIIQSLLRKYIPMPDSVKQRGITEQQFYNNLSAYARDLAGQPFDAAGFIKELDQRIVMPLKDAQGMLDRQKYLTRLFTTVSPEEMTRDPLFDYNPDLKPVSNVHTAQGTGTCTQDGQVTNVSLDFDNGDSFKIPGTFPPFGGPVDTTYAKNEPNAYLITLVGPNGDPVRVSKARASVFDQQLQSGMDPKIVRALAKQEEPSPPRIGGTPIAVGTPDTGCSCALGGRGRPATALLGLSVVALLLRRRRRS